MAGGSFTLTNDVWQHLVLTLGTNHVLRFYLNGVLVSSNTGNGPAVYDGTESFHIGKHHLLGRHFNGLVDECMVFNRPLSTGEVISLYVSQGGRLELSIQPEAGGVRLSWPLPEADWRLHWTPSLSTTPISWTEIAPPYQSNSTSIFHNEPSPLGNRFYRLHKP